MEIIGKTKHQGKERLIISLGDKEYSEMSRAERKELREQAKQVFLKAKENGEHGPIFQIGGKRFNLMAGKAGGIQPDTAISTIKFDNIDGRNRRRPKAEGTRTDAQNALTRSDITQKQIDDSVEGIKATGADHHHRNDLVYNFRNFLQQLSPEDQQEALAIVTAQGNPQGDDPLNHVARYGDRAMMHDEGMTNEHSQLHTSIDEGRKLDKGRPVATTVDEAVTGMMREQSLTAADDAAVMHDHYTPAIKQQTGGVQINGKGMTPDDMAKYSSKAAEALQASRMSILEGLTRFMKAV